MTDREKPALQLTEQDGNAFFVLGRATRAARAAGWMQAQIDEYVAKAKAGDYDHLLAVTQDYFDVY